MDRRVALAAVVSWALAAGPARAEDPLPPPRPVRGGPSAPSPDRTGSSARLVPGTATPADYRLTAGDEVEVEVSVPPEATAANPIPEPKRLVVAPGGALNLPKLKGVSLEGRAISQVEAEIEARLRTAGVSDRPEVFVRVTSFAARYVYLVGAVFLRLEVSPFRPTGILQLFAQAGDVMRDVDATRATVMTAGGEARNVDITALLRRSVPPPEAFLAAGDTVLLYEKPEKVEPEIPKVYILGAVRQPFAYRANDPISRQPVTLLQLLAFAGGTSEYADLDKVILRRSVGGRTNSTPINATAIIRNRAEDVVLQPGDIVFVED
jgi:protein involved in polysaccharide export with SLBB domain